MYVEIIVFFDKFSPLSKSGFIFSVHMLSELSKRKICLFFDIR